MSDPVTITSNACQGLLFVSLGAEEDLGELFRFHLQFESKDANIDLSALLGSSMTVTLTLQDGFTRHFNGIVSEASQIGVATTESLVYAQYSVVLVPKPWLLEQNVDCRIFTSMSTPDIITQVLSEVGYTDVKNSLSASYTKRDYCVQYRESSLNFIQRLMEQEGIYYYFTHTRSAHTMVLADGVGAHAVGPGFGTVPYAQRLDSVLRKDAAIGMFESLRGVDAATVKLTDYNPLTPRTVLDATDSSEGNSPPETFTAFDYPGTHATAAVGQHYANVWAEAVTAARSFYSGTTTACAASIGNLFTLGQHPLGALNQEYLITGTSIHMHGGSHASDGDDLDYACQFRALPGRIPFRKEPTAAKPRIVGVQTAIVTGSDTDEDIAVDKYGRIQVNFHWNMPGKKNAHCSCFARIASSWAGKSWGAVSIPRVGQEVVVSFIEGDPDRPLIVGSVYNADNMPPYSLPDNKTQSGIKSRSLLGGTDDYNELRLEDKKGSEDFFIHAQKDMHEEVENDHTVTIDHDEIITIKNDQTAEIKNNRTHTIDNDDTLTVKHDQVATIQNNRTHKVDQEEKLTVGANSTHSITQKFKLDAGTEIQLVCGASSITMKASGEIDIKGTTIKINGMQKIEAVGMMGVKVEGMKVELEAMTTAKMVGALSAAVEAGVSAKLVGGAQVGITGALIKLT